MDVEPIVIRNARVLIIPIGDYAASSGLTSLIEVRSDLARFRNLFENEYAYTVAPKSGSALDGKFFWTQSEIISFIEKESDSILGGDDEKEPDSRKLALRHAFHMLDAHAQKKFDSLIVVIRGHGDGGFIFDSEGRRIPLTLLHDVVSFNTNPRFEKMPRIFIVDVCRGPKGSKLGKATSTNNARNTKAPRGQRTKLITINGNVNPEDAGLLSVAALHVLKQNARRSKQLALLAADIRIKLNETGERHVSVLKGDPSLNSLWLKPNLYKLFPKDVMHELGDVMTWMLELTGYECDRSFDSLSDGHYLCLVLNAIKPQTCAIAFPPHTERNRQANIKAFILGCAKLKVDKQFVISQDTLDSQRNIVDVLCNIYALHAAVTSRWNYKKAQMGACKKVKKKGYCYIGKIAHEWLGSRRLYGKKISDDGEVEYAGGQTRSQEKDGWGTATHAKGTSYKGQWKLDQMHGYGKHSDSKGFTYEGSWKEDKHHGYGRLLCASGYAFEGQFENGVQSGHGKCTWADGSVYEGAYKEGKKHGRGVYMWPNGDKAHVEYENDELIKKRMFKEQCDF